jgi:hypothetical protein
MRALASKVKGKGHFATGERALFVSSENLGGLGPLGPPGSYATEKNDWQFWSQHLRPYFKSSLTLTLNEWRFNLSSH